MPGADDTTAGATCSKEAPPSSFSAAGERASDVIGDGMRIPKKKKYAAAADNVEAPQSDEPAIEAPTPGGNESGDRKGDVCTPNKAEKRDETSPNAFKPTSIGPASTNSDNLFDPPILRKGDLVRLSNEQRSGRIQGGLARVTRANFSLDDEQYEDEVDPTRYDIEYVLGGKLTKLRRCDLKYTTATAEGLVDATDNSRGHLLRRRRVVGAMTETQKEQEKQAPKDKLKKQRKETREASTDNTTAKRKRLGRLPGKKSTRLRKSAVAEEETLAVESEKSSLKKDGRERKGVLTSAVFKKHRGSKNSEAESTMSEKEIRSQAAKLGWEKRRNQETVAPSKPTAKHSGKAASKASSKTGSKPSASNKTANKSASNKSASNKRGIKRNSATDASECSDVAEGENIDGGGGRPSRRLGMYTRHRRELEKSLSRLEKVDRFGFFLDTPPPEFDENYGKSIDEEGEDGAAGENDSESEWQGEKCRRKTAVQFPDQPPFNFLVIRKRFAAGRYDLDMVALEQRRLRDIKAMLNGAATSDDDGNEYYELAKSTCHPIAVDWDTLNSDVIAMCDAAITRDPEGPLLGAGHLGWSANKIKKLMEEIYGIYGNKRRLEVDESEARAKYEKVLVNGGNMEAAMQGKWRKEAFPERKYERLENSSVICDGLSPKDRSYAMYELETKLPDSFVGLAYTYDDSGQHSETWMKTLAGETIGQQTKPQKFKCKKRKKAGDTDSLASSNKNSSGNDKAQKAAMALASDDGVVRAQVQTTMTTLLIQVQDRVMTDLGVMLAPEARSANWDDGDVGRDYRPVACSQDGGDDCDGRFEVEQGTHSEFSLPEVAEQEVWGIDCYTRKNVMTLIEEEFTSKIAIEFVEKWLLPAINACPVDLAYKMSTAAKMLEGVQLPAVQVDRRHSVAPSNSNTNYLAAAAANNPSQDSQILFLDQQQTKAPESSVFLRNALGSKIKEHAPPWLKAAARLIRLASDSLDDDFFRIHPKGHGSVVIGDDGLKANTLVTYYRGEVYPAWRWCEKLDAIDRVQKKLDLRPNLPDFYNMAMERPKRDPRGYCLLFVDASRKSGLGSSFSHSCNPTCEVRVVSLNGKLSLSMTTLRDLEQGEELTFDYNAVTESLDEYRFAVCLCGQKNCRGSFLHFATADCYQQVLSRNSPISARFANLVRGCMKQVMSKEDSELLLKHGFNTAAFGAVSFNHHMINVDPHSTPDSIENVPIWLRTFVADCLRYIEYERRALPVALLCNQMERMEKNEKERGTEPNAYIIKKEKKEFLSNESSKAVSGSKPKTSYFFFLQSQREHWEKIARKENEAELKGLELSQAINKVASRAWASLVEEEKQSWRKKSIADWKKNGGKEKAKLEEERQRSLKNSPEENAKASHKQKAEVSPALDEMKVKENKPWSNNDVDIEAKTISFADADAEGFSAMEQRIQQLAQSLSRIGRVLDRHRESVFAEMKDINATAVDSDLLRNLVPSPLKIMSEAEVVNWIWSNPKGVVCNLFSMMERHHFPERSLLRKLLLRTKEGFPVLSAFSLNHSVPSLEKKFKHACTSSDARRLVREALLKFRSNIVDFLVLAEKSNAEARNKKRRDQARAREEKKKQQNNRDKTISDRSECDTVDDGGFENIADDRTEQPSSLHKVKHESNMGDEAKLMRGGGGRECVSPDRPSVLFESQVLGQNSTSKPAGVEAPNGVSIEGNNGIVSNIGQQSTTPSTDGTLMVQSSVCEDVTSLLQFSHAAKNFDTFVAEDPAPGHENNYSSNYEPYPSTSFAKRDAPQEIKNSPSKLQDLIDAANCRKEVGIANDPALKEPMFVKDQTPLDLSFAILGDHLLAPLSTSYQVPTSPAASESKRAKKKAVPLSENQVKYLKDWLFDPKHILNPYPTDEDKSVMMKDLGIERKRLDGWFMKNRGRVLHPEIKFVKMKWSKLDQEHWSEFRKNRYMLESTADLLLMYASTNTFFLLEPFRQFDSTPIEVYARELGNEVPCHFALNCKMNSYTSPLTVDSDADVPVENATSGVIVEKTKNSSKKTKLKSKCTNEFCSPEEVIDKVTVDYSGEYVLSQLLQWVNGGIGQKKGLPDIYGCVMLPPVSGCWEEIKCSEVKLPNYTKWNCKTTTEYDANVRPKLAEWMGDRYQRGSPWDKNVAKYFCPRDQAVPDSTLPMGSPVIDYLVTGIDDNLRQCQSALSGCVNTTEQRRSTLSASDRLQSTVDEGMPAQAVANWVQCENPKCLKWRKLPWHVDVDLLPQNFFCKDNIWNPKSQTCDAPEDEWDMEDAPIKFDTQEKFEVGAWFDVQRECKIGYHEAQVIEVDFESNVKQIKFHFWKLSSDRDEWIEVGSPRIAPHHSYTPRPLDGYGAPKSKIPDKTKANQSQSKIITGSDKSLGSNRQLSYEITGNLHQKTKVDDSSKHAAGTVDEAKKVQQQFPQSTIDYLNDWVSQHAANPFPSTGEKAKIMADTGLSKRQVGDWMARARKKLRRKSSQSGKKSSQDEQPANKPSTDVTALKRIPSSPTKVENLLLALRNQGNAPSMPHENAMQLAGETEQIDPMESPDGSVLAGKVGMPIPTTELGGEKQKTTIKELEAYMKAWLSCPAHACNLMPSLAQKEKIIQETGIEKKRLEGWFFRARKKMKKQQEQGNGLQNLQPSTTRPSTASVANTASVSSGTAQAIGIQLSPKNLFSTPHTGIYISPTKTSEASSRKGGGAKLQAPPTKEGAAKLQVAPVNGASGKLPASSIKGGLGKLQASPTKEGTAKLPASGASGITAKLPTSDMNAVQGSQKLTHPMKVDEAKVPISPIQPSSSNVNKGLSDEAKNHLKRWLSEHSLNPYPTREEKDGMMSLLGIKDERKLEGWFCRARKKLKQSNGPNNLCIKSKMLDSSKTPENREGDEHGKYGDDDVLHPSGHSADGANQVIQHDQVSESLLLVASPFASLLNAAKSELGQNLHRSSPHIHHDSIQYGNTASIRATEVPRDGLHQQQKQTLPHNTTQHVLTPPPHEGINKFRNLGSREQAILSSFQSLQSMEIHDRSSRRASPVEHSLNQHTQSQQQTDSMQYLPYNQSQNPHQAPLVSSYHHAQDHQQVPTAEYPSYQHSQGHQQDPDKYFEHSQGHQQAPPGEYYHRSKEHQLAPPAEYESYQDSQGPAPTDYQSYRRLEGQQLASSAEYHSYQHSEGRTAPAGYPSYQHLECQQQSQGNIFHHPYEGAPHGSYTQDNGFHQGHLSYGQHHNPACAGQR